MVTGAGVRAVAAACKGSRKHQHYWNLSKVVRYTNRPNQGWSEWACECGAVKKVDIFDACQEKSE